MKGTFLRDHSVAILVGLCVVSFLLLFAASWRDAAIVDELAHIPAGYSYVHFLDYRLNPEHPPLLKALAALPLLFLHLKFPDTNPFWTTAVNGEWGVGGAFLYGLGNNAFLILQVARIVPMLLTIALIIVVYLWARRLFGDPAWALVPAGLIGLSPIFIAQGHYVTTDVAATFGTVIGLWSFDEYLRAPTKKRMLVAGLCFGIGELMKFSVTILIPVYAVVLIVRAIADRRIARYAGMFFAVMGIGLIVVYAIYALFTAHYPIARQISDTQATVGYLAQQGCGLTHWSSCLASLDIWGAGHYLTRPLAEYLLGILMVAERISGTNLSYFLGQVSQQGSFWYFPTVYALKETIPALIIIFVGLIFGAARFFSALFGRGRRAFFEYIRTRSAEFSMIVFVIIYWGVSVRSPLNIGVRHILPTIPLFYMLAVGAIRRGGAIQRKTIFVSAAMLWLAGETAFAYPSYLSYFNEFAGGTANGYRYVADSNYDWGQDMLALQVFMNQHPEMGKVALDFFGGSNPSYYLGDRYVAWRSSMGDPTAQGIQWFAVSINNLQDAIQPTAPDYARNASDSYQWLLQGHPTESGMGGVPPPDYRIGTTIFVYKL